MKKSYFFVIAAVIVAVAIAASIIFSQLPSKSTIKPANSGASLQEQNGQPKKVETAYFITTLPAGFEIKTNTESVSSGQDMIQIVATQPRSNGQQIAITAGVLPSEGLGGVASYNLRIKNPDTYTQIEFGGMPAGAPTFYSTAGAGYEITTFWPQAALFSSISVSGISADKTAINQTLTQVLGSWQWR